MRNKFTGVWIWLFLMPLALNVKASEDTASHLAQILLVVPSVGAGCLLLLIAPRFEHRSHMRKVLTFALLLTMLGRAILPLAALPATSIGGNPLGPRFSGLVFGVALGMLVATYGRIAQTMRVRAARPVGRPHRAQPMSPTPQWPHGTLDGHPGLAQLPPGLRGKAQP